MNWICQLHQFCNPCISDPDVLWLWSWCFELWMFHTLELFCTIFWSFHKDFRCLTELWLTIWSLQQFQFSVCKRCWSLTAVNMLVRSSHKVSCTSMISVVFFCSSECKCSHPRCACGTEGTEMLWFAMFLLWRKQQRYKQTQSFPIVQLWEELRSNCEMTAVKHVWPLTTRHPR